MAAVHAPNASAGQSPRFRSAASRGPRCLLLCQVGCGSRRPESLAHHRPGRERRAGRRIGLRQDHGGDGGHGLSRAQRPHRARPGAIRRAGHGLPFVRGAASHPGLEDGHGVPGADERTEPLHAGGIPAHGGADGAQGGIAQGGACPGGRDSPEREHVGPRNGDAPLPAPALGRAAAARGDRDGLPVQPLPAGARRTDHRARRDGGSERRRPHRGAAAQVWHFVALHLAQPRPHREGMRPGVRDVLGRGGRGGHDSRGFRAHPAPLHPRSARVHPESRHRQARTVPGADSRSARVAPRTSPRVRLRPAVSPFRGGPMRSRLHRDGSPCRRVLRTASGAGGGERSSARPRPRRSLPTTTLRSRSGPSGSSASTSSTSNATCP